MKRSSAYIHPDAVPALLARAAEEAGTRTGPDNTKAVNTILWDHDCIRDGLQSGVIIAVDRDSKANRRKVFVSTRAPRPSFAGGFGSVLDIGGGMVRLTVAKNPSKRDAAALRSDWWSVGRVLRKAIRSVGRSK
jgi:hypothetical protein